MHNRKTLLNNPLPLALFAVFLFQLTSTRARAADEAPRTISANGEAVVYVVPDEVMLGFGVETRHSELDKAKSENDDSCTKLVKAIKAVGVEEKHIQTDAMAVELRYKNDGMTIDGYVCRRTYSICLKEPKNLEKLIETALKNGANHLLGFEYRTTELRKHRDHARSMAITAAKEKAQALAKDLDCKTGKPRTITEGYGWYGYYGSTRFGGGYGGNAMAQNTAQAAGGASAEGGEQSPFGQIGIRASVTVTFDLESK